MKQDVRWRQRFQNFSKAIMLLDESSQIQHPTEIEKAGIIQVFEFTFELAWKTIKDFLEEKGIYNITFPKDIIKEGFSFEIIKNGDVWMDMLEKRNLMSHTYDEHSSQKAYNLIVNNYLKELLALHVFFNSKL